MLSKGQLADEICAVLAEDGITVPRRNVTDVLNGLTTVAEKHIAEGEDFTVPGIARISWRFRAAKKKGERWKKGDMVQGFGGSSEVKDSDSPPITAKARLVASPTGAVGRLKPKADDATQKDFLKSKAGKNIATRKS